MRAGAVTDLVDELVRGSVRPLQLGQKRCDFPLQHTRVAEHLSRERVADECVQGQSVAGSRTG